MNSNNKTYKVIKNKLSFSNIQQIDYNNNVLSKNFDKKVKVNNFKIGGSTSVSVLAPYFFIKYIVKYQEYHVYQREKYIASILNKFDWFPTLLYSDDINKVFIFKNVGVPINKKNKPADLQEQFEKISTDMKSVNVQHNDISPKEILVDTNGKVYLCDFGWGSIDGWHGCNIGIWNKAKPYGILNDSEMFKLIIKELKN